MTAAASSLWGWWAPKAWYYISETTPETGARAYHGPHYLTEQGRVDWAMDLQEAHWGSYIAQYRWSGAAWERVL